MGAYERDWKNRLLYTHLAKEGKEGFQYGALR